MKMPKNEIEEIVNLANFTPHPIQFTAGVNSRSRTTKGVQYFMDKFYPNWLVFFKAQAFVPNFYRWPSGIKQLCPHERTYRNRAFFDKTRYPDKCNRNRFFKNLSLNYERDFIDRQSDTPSQNYEVFQTIDTTRPIPGLSGVNVGRINIPQIPFDAFLNNEMIARTEFERPSYMPAMYPEQAQGFVVFTNEQITTPINEVQVVYYNPYGAIENPIDLTQHSLYAQDLNKYRQQCSGVSIKPGVYSQSTRTCMPASNRPLPGRKDIVDMIMLWHGICPKSNPSLKKIIAYDLMKQLKQTGMSIFQLGNKYILNCPKHILKSRNTVGGLFDSWWKKLVRGIKSVGRKIEKHVWTPIRKYLKDKAPAVWSVIDKVDKKIGLNKTMKKYAEKIEKLGNKYGSKLMETAIMAGANYAGTSFGVDPSQMQAVTKTAIKYADVLTGTEKEKMKFIAENAARFLGDDTKKADDYIFGGFMDNVKKEMTRQKGKEGVKDFDDVMDIMSNIYAEAAKTTTDFKEDVTKKIKSAVNITPEDIKKVEPYKKALIEKAAPQVSDLWTSDVTKRKAAQEAFQKNVDWMF